MAKRLLTAAVAIPLVVVIVGWFPPLGLIAVVAALAAAGYAELRMLAAAHGIQVQGAAGMAATALVAASPGLGAGAAVPVLTATVLAILTLAIAARRPLAEALPCAGATLAGVLWIGWLAGYLVRLQAVAARGSLLFVLLAAVWLGDAGAMWTGKLLGRHNLSPVISPKKTVEGLVGGALATLGGLALASRLLATQLPFELGAVHLAVLGVLLAASAAVGDLVESAFKRGAGTKDSGGLFPGHGGVLDRVDSLLFAAPVLYHYCEWLGRG